MFVLLCSLEHVLELKEQERDQFGGWDKGRCQGCGGWDDGDGGDWSCVLEQRKAYEIH